MNDYQHGHCHHFASKMAQYLAKRLPTVELKFCIIEGHTDDKDFLIHVYVYVQGQKDFCLIDSTGVYFDMLRPEQNRQAFYNYFPNEVISSKIDIQSEIPHYPERKDFDKNQLNKDVTTFMKYHSLLSIVEKL